MDKRVLGSFPPKRTTRFRLAAILLAMAGAIMVGKLFEDSLIERLRRDCTSLFDDRLVPAMTLFHLCDHMNLKYRLLRDYIDDVPGVDAKRVQYEMGQHDGQLADLMLRFHQTYLVEDESQLLHDFSSALAEFQRLEQRVIESKGKGSAVPGRAALEEAYARIRKAMLALTDVQQRVGSELRAESAAIASSMTSLLYFQLGVAFVLGLISSGLAMSLGRPERRVETDPGLH